MGLLAFGVNSRPAAAFVCGLALACGAWAQDTNLVIVTSVIDGDTIKVQVAEGPVTVRLRDIDAPELNQPGGGAATRALRQQRGLWADKHWSRPGTGTLLSATGCSSCRTTGPQRRRAA